MGEHKRGSTRVPPPPLPRSTCGRMRRLTLLVWLALACCVACYAEEENTINANMPSADTTSEADFGTIFNEVSDPTAESQDPTAESQDPTAESQEGQDPTAPADDTIHYMHVHDKEVKQRNHVSRLRTEKNEAQEVTPTKQRPHPLKTSQKDANLNESTDNVSKTELKQLHIEHSLEKIEMDIKTQKRLIRDSRTKLKQRQERQ